MEESNHNAYDEATLISSRHSTGGSANRTQLITHDDDDRLLAQSMCEFIVPGSYAEWEVERSVVPSSFGLVEQSVSSSATSSGRAAERAKRRREKQAGYKRKQREAESTEESKYWFDERRSGEYIMMSAMDNLRLRFKVVNSLKFAREMPSEHRKQLVERLDTLVGRLEARYKTTYSPTDGASGRARGHRKVEMRHALTKLINDNSCSPDDSLSTSIDYDACDDLLRVFEANWMSWYPEDKGRLRSWDEVGPELQAERDHVTCLGRIDLIITAREHQVQSPNLQEGSWHDVRNGTAPRMYASKRQDKTS